MSPGTDKIRSAAAEAVAGPFADTRHALRVSVMSPATRPTTVVGPVPVVKDGIVSHPLCVVQTSADPCSCRGRGTAPLARLGHIWRYRNPGRIIQADRYNGSPSHPAGRDSKSPPPGPTRFRSEGSADAVAGAPFL
jgi:hypothetical protein